LTTSDEAHALITGATAEPTDKPAIEVRRHATHGPSLRERAALERRLP